MTVDVRGGARALETSAAVVAKKINAEVVVLLGWGPAILLQLAHPLVAAGVAEHSSFRASPATRLARLRSTVDSMLAITFGTPEEGRRAAAAINRIHDRVNGRLGEVVGTVRTGTPYSAHDPELLRWVHATLLLTLPRAYELYVGPLSDAEKDRYCSDAASVGPLLGIPAHLMPRSQAEVRAYVEGMLGSGEIAVSGAARGLAQALLAPLWPRVLWPLYLPARLAAVGLLPPSVREAYGFRWGPAHERGLIVSGRLVRLLLPWVPRSLRRWPAARAA